VAPEEDTCVRFFAPPSTSATAALVAAAAGSARAFAHADPAFARACLDAAWRGWAWLRTHPSEAADLSAFSTGEYQSTKANFAEGARLWAAAELWETTGDGDVLGAAEALASTAFGRDPSECGSALADEPRDCLATPLFDWSSLQVMATIRLALTRHAPGLADAGGSLAARASSAVLVAARAGADAALAHPYGRPVGSTYMWGVNGDIARTSVLFHAASRIERRSEAAAAACGHPRRGAAAAEEEGAAVPPRLARPPRVGNDNRFLRAASLGLAHVLGANAYGRSFVTGLGYGPPANPHHRPSMHDHAAWPGYLVGGPEDGALTWTDDKLSFKTNEVAINWQAALVFNLALFLPQQSMSPIPVSDNSPCADLGLGPSSALQGDLWPRGSATARLPPVDAWEVASIYAHAHGAVNTSHAGTSTGSLPVHLSLQQRFNSTPTSDSGRGPRASVQAGHLRRSNARGEITRGPGAAEPRSTRATGLPSRVPTIIFLTAITVFVAASIAVNHRHNRTGAARHHSASTGWEELFHSTCHGSHPRRRAMASLELV